MRLGIQISLPACVVLPFVFVGIISPSNGANSWKLSGIVSPPNGATIWVGFIVIVELFSFNSYTCILLSPEKERENKQGLVNLGGEDKWLSGGEEYMCL